MSARPISNAVTSFNVAWNHFSAKDQHSAVRGHCTVLGHCELLADFGHAVAKLYRCTKTTGSARSNPTRMVLQMFGVCLFFWACIVDSTIAQKNGFVETDSSRLFYESESVSILKDGLKKFISDQPDLVEYVGAWQSLLIPSAPRHEFSVPRVYSRRNMPSDREKKIVQALRPMLNTVSDEAVRTAERFSRQDDPAKAYAWYHRALAFNYKTIKAGKILAHQIEQLGTRKVKRRSLPSQSDLGWPAGRYSRIETANFEILSQAPAKRAHELADICESTLCVWRQLFFDYWANDQHRKSILQGREVSFTEHKPIRVVLFRSKEDYVDLLQADAPGIERSVGYYSPKVRTAFFYWQDDEAIETMRHELTHAFFYHFGSRTDQFVDFEKQRSVWALEGVAMYMESCTERVSPMHRQIAVGGWDAPRLAAARYRRLHDQFWIDFGELNQTSGAQWVQNEDLPMWYSQSAGLSQFMIESSSERRTQLIEFLVASYSVESATLKLTESEDQFRADYDRYLQGEVGGFNNRLTLTPRSDVVLPRTSVDDSVLLNWGPNARVVEWFDLSFTKVTDRLFAESESSWLAKRLNVESTLVTDKSMLAFSQMPELVELDLSNCRISDSGLRELANASKLKTLWLTGTEITDAAIESLTRIKTLQFVELTGTNVTTDGIKQLKRAIRKIKVSQNP